MSKIEKKLGHLYSYDERAKIDRIAFWTKCFNFFWGWASASTAAVVDLKCRYVSYDKRQRVLLRGKKEKKRFYERVCKWGPIRYPRPQNVHIIITVYITNVLIDCRRDWTWSIQFPDETDRNDDEHSLDDTNVIAFLQINSSKSLKPTTNNFLCVFLQKKSRKICQFLTAIAGCV